MKSFLFIFLFAGFTSLQAQQDGEKVFWQEDPLSWEEFKGNPNDASPFHANTSSGLSFSWGLKQKNDIIELQYEVSSYFNPLLSWVKPGSKDDYLLRHEQLHFNITELHARKLRKEMSNVSVEKLGKNGKEVLNSIYQKVEKERDLMQRKYDNETNHSLNREAEAKWQKFVKEELNKLKAYENLNIGTSSRAASNSEIISLTI